MRVKSMPQTLKKMPKRMPARVFTQGELMLRTQCAAALPCDPGNWAKKQLALRTKKRKTRQRSKQ